jgi:hypothetical protein
MSSWVPDWSITLREKSLPARRDHEKLIPWWSLPSINETGMMEHPGGWNQDDLRRLAREILDRKVKVKFGALQSWVLDTVPADMAKLMRERLQYW